MSYTSLNNQFFNDLGSHRKFWVYAGCNQRIFFFVKEIGGHLHFVKFPLWKVSSYCNTSRNVPKHRMTGRNMCLEPSVPLLNCIICSWKLVICVAKHIPKINWKCWYTSWSIDTESPNIIILEVVQNSICIIDFDIDCKSKQQVGQMSFGHRFVVQMPRH